MQRGKKRSRSSISNNKTDVQPVWKVGLEGLILAWIATLIGLFAAAGMIYWEWIEASLISMVAKGIMIFSMFAGSVYIFKKTQGKNRIWVLIMLIAYLAIRFLVSLILTFR